MTASDNELLLRLDRALHAVEKRLRAAPEVAVILGSGLGDFTTCLSDSRSIDYVEIPEFPKHPTSVEGHAGMLHVGDLGGRRVAVLSGRFHAYEGMSLPEIVFPVRLMGRWGVRTLVVTNAAGAVNHAFSPGDLMVIRDHINALFRSPLAGPNQDALGPRFLDMVNAYSPALRQQMRRAADRLGLNIREGVYCCMPGPQYETPAEIRMLSLLGADAVGMSTVPEVIAARHMGMSVVAISHITNMAAGLSGNAISHAEVLEEGARSTGRLAALVRTFLEGLPVAAS